MSKNICEIVNKEVSIIELQIQYIIKAIEVFSIFNKPLKIFTNNKNITDTIDKHIKIWESNNQKTIDNENVKYVDYYKKLSKIIENKPIKIVFGKNTEIERMLKNNLNNLFNL
ncbi:44215_t:CDS:1 [Gigaspora margarita]|uniref:44215_t:CDS:1 n=1 Tax=Gigaspora margarita TaxID=4874 RepID=A0ABN7WDN7_GIGMA|nr:44215_t:CDS:1 [Gigaspora margarita]